MNTSKSKSGEAAVYTNFSRVIKKLETLEEYAKYYREHWPSGEIDHRGLNTGADNYWSQNVQPLVEDINLDIENIWSYLTTYTRQGDNFGGYFPPVGTLEQNLREDINYVINKAKNPDYIHALTQHLKIVQQRIKIRSELSGESQPQKKTNSIRKRPKGELMSQVKNLKRADPDMNPTQIAETLNKTYKNIYRDTSRLAVVGALKRLEKSKTKNKKR